MAIFRKRRSRSTPPPQEPVETPAPPPPPTGEALRQALRAIADAAVAPEDALEPALRAILDATRAQAGALELFDSRYALLRLVSEVGLSDEGCRRLRTVRRGDPASWDMPLQGLLNRRAYLIESAARNRYVPRLVEHASLVRTIACLPLYAGASPVGSLVLIAQSPRSFGERDVRMLERPIAELGDMIEKVRRRGGQADEPAPGAVRRSRAESAADVHDLFAERERLRAEMAARLAERAVLAAEVTSRSGEADRLRSALEAATAERARLAAELERVRREGDRLESVSAALAAAEQERSRLAAVVEAAAAERAERARVELALEQARATAERSAAEAAAQLEAARRAASARQAEASARAAELATEVEDLHARVARAETALERARALVREREEERDRIAEEVRAATERERRLREDLEAASGHVGGEALQHALETARQAEGARAAAASEAESVRRELASVQQVVLALEDEAARANADVERLTAAGRASAEEYERLELSLAEGRARELAAKNRVGELTRELDALRLEHGPVVAAARERDARLAGLTARAETIAAERDRLRVALTAAEDERTRLATELEAATAAQATLRDSLARESAERTRLSAALGTAQAALGELEATLRSRDADKDERAAEVRRGERSEPSAPAAPQPAASRPPEPIRLVTVTTPPANRPRPRDDDARPLVGILDVDAGWQRAAGDRREVIILPPADDLAAELSALAPTRIVANLAAPGALGALAALRARGSAARFWGCIADPQADRALPLGMIEPAVSPLDPDAAVDVLSRYAVRGTRVVTIGADVDALMSLRQALARRGLSVSMAWDAKQGIDLLGVVRPELVVVELGLPRRDGYGIVAQLCTVDPVPNALIVPGREEPSIGFTALLNDPAHAPRTVTLAELIARALARAETTPAERRGKLRAFGRK